jgi:hypothetical protein
MAASWCSVDTYVRSVIDERQIVETSNSIGGGIELDDPITMLLLLDDDLLEGRYNLYPWQMEIMKDFAADSSSQHPFQAAVRAANGSGKDKYIIASCAVWLAMRYPQTVCVVTSASGTQLDRQTNTYIELLAHSANNKINRDLWKCNYRHYECQFPQANGEVLRSTIELFVTDESGRAEGWHPIGYNTHLGIFTSEAKSIPDEIFTALARCTGFTKRVDVSSPGLPMGHFFNRCTSGNWRKYHITAFDCPHLSREYIEQCRIDYGGESSALYRSMVLAEFGTTDEMVVIPYHSVWKCIYNQCVPHFSEEVNTGGLDLAAGGDETVLCVRNGNKVIKIEGFREEDTAKTIRRLESLFIQHCLNKPNAYIYADAGGLGKPIIDQLKDRGWYNIRYVLNNSKAQDKKAYYNRGTELWFRFGRLCEVGEILLCDDERLKRQLSTRYYKQSETGALLLESKLQARAKGHPSPDRADATVLAFSTYKTKLGDAKPAEEPLPKRPAPEEPTSDFTVKEHAKRQTDRSSYDRYYGGSDDKRQNLTELQQLIAEHNEKLKRRKEELLHANDN